jgi:hypothetical protein
VENGAPALFSLRIDDCSGYDDCRAPDAAWVGQSSVGDRAREGFAVRWKKASGQRVARNPEERWASDFPGSRTTAITRDGKRR